MKTMQDLAGLVSLLKDAAGAYEDAARLASGGSRSMLEGFAREHAVGADHLTARLARWDIATQPAPRAVECPASIERQILCLAESVPGSRIADDVRYAVQAIVASATWHARWLAQHDIGANNLRAA
jgi:hypothetical protein